MQTNTVVAIFAIVVVVACVVGVLVWRSHSEKQDDINKAMSAAVQKNFQTKLDTLKNTIPISDEKSYTELKQTDLQKLSKELHASKELLDLYEKAFSKNALYSQLKTEYDDLTSLPRCADRIFIPMKEEQPDLRNALCMSGDETTDFALPDSAVKMCNSINDNLTTNNWKKTKDRLKQMQNFNDGFNTNEQATFANLNRLLANIPTTSHTFLKCDNQNTFESLNSGLSPINYSTLKNVKDIFGNVKKGMYYECSGYPISMLKNNVQIYDDIKDKLKDDKLSNEIEQYLQNIKDLSYAEDPECVLSVNDYGPVTQKAMDQNTADKLKTFNDNVEKITKNLTDKSVVCNNCCKYNMDIGDATRLQMCAQESNAFTEKECVHYKNNQKDLTQLTNNYNIYSNLPECQEFCKKGGDNEPHWNDTTQQCECNSPRKLFYVDQNKTSLGCRYDPQEVVQHHDVWNPPGTSGIKDFGIKKLVLSPSNK